MTGGSRAEGRKYKAHRPRRAEKAVKQAAGKHEQRKYQQEKCPFYGYCIQKKNRTQEGRADR